MSTMKTRRTGATVRDYTLMTIAAVIMFAPIYYLLIGSLKPSAQVLDGFAGFLPTNLSFDNYVNVFTALSSDATGHFWQFMFNSIAISAVIVIAGLVVNSMAGYAFARLDFPGKRVVFGLYLATMMIPLQVLVVPLFIEFRDWQLQDTLFALIAPTVASAFGVFLLRQAIQAVPKELDEAATIDGAGHLRIFARIILPLVRPELATVGIFGFMASWNSFLWPLVVIRSPELQTLPLGLATLQGQFTTRWDVVMAGSVVSILPMALVYLVAQRHVIAGVAHTGLK